MGTLDSLVWEDFTETRSKWREELALWRSEGGTEEAGRRVTAKV